MCERTKHWFYSNLSRKVYDSYAKDSQFIKIFNEHGIRGLEELRRRDLACVDERVKMANDLWINAPTLICIYHENMDLVRYLLEFIAIPTIPADNPHQQEQFMCISQISAEKLQQLKQDPFLTLSVTDGLYTKFLNIIPKKQQRQLTCENGDCCPLLHLLCQTDIMDDRIDMYLRYYNVDINILDSFGRNCLFYVKLPEMYDYLVSRGANEQIRDNFGCSPHRV